MRLTKQTHYAIGILRLCAQAGDALVKAADIARELEMTTQNTFKSVHILTKAGFLAPVRGRNGGIRLARPADQIRVSDVVRVIEFESEPPEPSEERSGGGPLLDTAFAAFLAVLEQHTIADLAEKAKPRRSSATRTSDTAKRPAGRPGKSVGRVAATAAKH
jgi:Rrf2 family nitric oxide-sensitive transcriptional repressor